MEALLTLNGYVGQEPELRTTKTGVPALSLRVASTPRYHSANGWVDGVTNWMTVLCYRQLAVNCKQSLVKGDPVLVQGRLRAQEWFDGNGERHERQVIEAVSLGHDLTRGVSHFSKMSLTNTSQPSHDDDWSNLPTDGADGEGMGSTGAAPVCDEDPQTDDSAMEDLLQAA